MINITEILQKNNWNPVNITLPGNIKCTLIPHFNDGKRNINTLNHITVCGTAIDCSGNVFQVEDKLEHYVENKINVNHIQ